MRRSNLATLLYLGLVFLSGAVVGGFAVRLYTARTVSATQNGPRNRAEIRKQYVEEMRSRLHLNDAQITSLNQIMDDTGQQMHQMHKSIEDQHVNKVIALLDDSQKAEYGKMREEREKRRQEQAKKGF